MEIIEFHSVSDDLLQVFSDKALLHFTDLDWCASSQAPALVAWATDPWRISLAGYEQGEFVGFASAHVVEKHLTASITIVVVGKFQGRGFSAELLRELVSILKAKGIVRVEAQICTENTASVRLFESLGFQREGTLRKNFLIDGILRDSYMYALIVG